MNIITKNQNIIHKISKFKLWKLLSYFIIYSIAGYIIETLFAFIMYGVLESRQSFLYGPFCSIYGIGAIIMIIFLQFFQKNIITLFIGGFLIGSVTEYLVSFLGELTLHVKWWDYTNIPFNLNGRICLYFSLLWGLLAIVFMKFIHPIVRNFLAWIIKKFSFNILKKVIYSITFIIVIDCFLSAQAINLFTIRMISIYDLNVSNKSEIRQTYTKLENNSFFSSVSNTIFNNEKMIRTYPNLKLQQLDGSMVYLKDLQPNIKPYYYSFKNTP